MRRLRLNPPMNVATVFGTTSGLILPAEASGVTRRCHRAQAVPGSSWAPTRGPTSSPGTIRAQLIAQFEVVEVESDQITEPGGLDTIESADDGP